MQEELKPLYETARRQRTVVPDALFAQMAAYALEQPHFSDVDAHVDILGIEETLVKARKIFSTPNETVH